MLVKFTIPISTNWYAVGTASILEDYSMLSFDDGFPLVAFQMKKKSIKDKLIIRIDHYGEEEEFDASLFDDDRTVVFGTKDRDIVVAKPLDNIELEFLLPMCEMVNLILCASVMEQKTSDKRDLPIENIPQEVRKAMQNHDIVLDLIEAGYSIEEQTRIMNDTSFN